MPKILLALLFAILALAPLAMAQLEAQENAEGKPRDADPRQSQSLWARIKRRFGA